MGEGLHGAGLVGRGESVEHVGHEGAGLRLLGIGEEGANPVGGQFHAIGTEFGGRTRGEAGFDFFRGAVAGGAVHLGKEDFAGSDLGVETKGEEEEGDRERAKHAQISAAVGIS
jgi:hypothetical protein